MQAGVLPHGGRQVALGAGYCGMDVLIERADLSRYRLACYGGLDGAAIGMSQHQNGFQSQYSCTIFQAGDGIRGGNIAGHANHEDMANALIEYQSPWGRPVARWTPAWGDEKREMIEAGRARLVQKFGEERGLRMAELSRNMIIFPNLVINDIMAITVRTFQPLAPDRMAVSAWAGCL